MEGREREAHAADDAGWMRWAFKPETKERRNEKRLNIKSEWELVQFVLNTLWNC